MKERMLETSHMTNDVIDFTIDDFKKIITVMAGSIKVLEKQKMLNNLREKIEHSNSSHSTEADNEAIKL